MRELSERSGVYYRTLLDLENGHTPKPQPKTLIRIADALGVDIDEMLRD